MKYYFIGLFVLFAQVISLGQSKTIRIDSLIKAFNQTNAFNGCVLVAENGKIVYHGAAGFSDFESGTKLEKDAIFNIASASKSLTAMTIMILHERGQLNVDDDISKYLTKLPYKGISIRNLLNHTSGLPDFSNEFEQVKELIDLSKPFGNKELLKLLEEKKPELNFEPGEKYSYSNTGYNLLTTIVERVSGIPFEKFIAREIFKPLKMNNSYAGPTFKKGAETKGHRYKNEQYGPDSLGFYIKELRGSSFEFSTQGSGGIRSTVEDLYKFDQALRNGKLVSIETLEMAYTKATLNNGKQIPYGFGWRIYEDATMKSVYHGGSVPGFRVLFRRGIKNDLNTIILLSNATNASSFGLLNKINAILSK